MCGSDGSRRCHSGARLRVTVGQGLPPSPAPPRTPWPCPTGVTNDKKKAGGARVLLLSRNFILGFSMPFGVCVYVQHCIPPNARHADRLHAHVVYALARTGNIERALKAFPGSDVSPGRRRRRRWRPSLPTSCCNKHFSTGQPRNGRSASLVAFSWLGTTRSRICQPHMPCWASAP